MGISKQQLYSSNTNIKYPFDDTHEYDIPDNIVVDMSLSVPSTVTPIISVISVTPFIFFMAIEDLTSKEAIGQVAVSRAQPFKIYDITMTMDNAFGWVVLGPGRNISYENRHLTLYPDQTVVLNRPLTTNFFSTLELNGFLYEDIIGNLNITANNPYIKITQEDRPITGLEGETSAVTKTCIVLSRDDGEVPVNTIYGGLLESSREPFAPATSIAGVVADSLNNINIGSVADDLNVGLSRDVLTDKILGLILYRTEESSEEEDDVCIVKDPLRKIKHGRCDEGIDLTDGLPLDPVVEALKPEYLEDDCGCTDEESSNDST